MSHCKMYEMRTTYILLLLIAGTCCYECFGRQGCTCLESPNDDIEFSCPIANDSSLIINVKPHKYIQIQCENSPDWSNAELLSDLFENHRIESVLIRMCSLPRTKSLGDITEQLGLKSLESLTFQSFGNISDTLRRSHFKKLATLKKLHLPSNNIMNLTRDLLVDLPELRWLNLRDNSLKHLPGNLFNENPLLELLELGNNLLDSIEAGAFDRLIRLRFLNLWNNQLDNLKTNTFSKLASLRSLDLNNNYLSTLPSNIFVDLENLLTLSLHGNNFISLPQDLFKYNEKLESIKLHNNKGNMITLPNLFFSNLTKLKIIKLQKDGLYELPEDIFWGSVSLTSINVRRNYLTTLPEMIFRDTSQLDVLDLSSNEIDKLPDFLFSNTNRLTKLNLSKNRMTMISENLFVGLNSLKELNMNENELKVIQPLGFAPLQKLEIARLSYNNLTLNTSRTVEYSDEYGTKSPFQHTRDLRELHLAHNHISEIFSDWMFTHTLLRILDLRYNDISSLSAYDLQFVSNGVKVDLTDNNIKHIYLNEIEEIARYQNTSRHVTILVENNPLQCDCDLYNLLRYFEGEMHPFVQNLFHIKSDSLTCIDENQINVKVENLRSKTLKCTANDRDLERACIRGCACSIEPSTHTYIIDCSYKNFTALNIDTLRINESRRYKINLNLTGNRLTHVPNIDNLSVLILSDNNIEHVPYLSGLNSNIKVLELHKNNIRKFNSTFLESLNNSTTLKRLTLSGNPWQCDCDTKDFVNFVQRNLVKIPDHLDIACDNKNISYFKELAINELCPLKVSVIIGTCFTIASLSLTLGIVIALYYRYQQEIKVWLYSHQLCLWFLTENQVDKDKLYDAFVSYSHKDEHFVLNELIPNLENGSRPYKLCLHYRDWLAGEWIPRQIVRSVECSKRTIIILSPNFLESVWSRLEFRAAHCQALAEGRARVIVILYGQIEITKQLDPELKAYLSINTYVKYGDPWFWDKLKYALPHASAKLTKHRSNDTADFNKQLAHLNSPNNQQFTPFTSSKIF